MILSFQSQMTPNAPKRIAILGGGVGSLTAALRLTEQPGWQSNYDITVYQMGWRLGGKGASGRGPHGRIEEHGLHIWLGFYDNAFRCIQQVYRENEPNRPAGAPLRTWDEAFKQQSFVCLCENIGGQWRVWPANFPVNESVPGAGGPGPSLWDYILMTLELLRNQFRDSRFSAESNTVQGHLDLIAWVHNSVHALEVDFMAGCVSAATGLLDLALHLARMMNCDPHQHLAKEHLAILSLLDRFMTGLRDLLAGRIESDDEARRLFVVMDLGTTVIRGLLQDGVLFADRELDSVEEDLQTWLKRHGAADTTWDIQKSGPVRGLYDLGFAYPNGDPARASFAAGPALRCVFKMCLCYKGAVFWKMQAGMGDTIFAPIYSVLRTRGVKFEFFHRVENLGLSEDKSRVSTIRIGRQVSLKDAPREYQPLVQVQSLPCWPSEPDYDQLVEGDRLRAEDIDLESSWTPWTNVETRVLQAGIDFDAVVLGISLGSLPFIAPELIAASPKWAAMCAHMQTVRTMALQLWMKPGLAELGWPLPSTVLDGFVEPLDTWADMSQLIPRESWPAGLEPRSIAYFCGTMAGGIPDFADHDVPAEERAKVQAASVQFLNESVGRLWPDALAAGGFNQALVIDRYVRANIDPSERYVLAVEGSTKYRLIANQSGFANLVLAGDWTDNGLNAGCVEAAVISGLLAANAVLGRPLQEGIIGVEPQFVRALSGGATDACSDRVIMPMKVREVVRLLEKQGWVDMRSKGSHRNFKHPNRAFVITVPGNDGKELAAGTLNAILKKAGLK